MKVVDRVAEWSLRHTWEWRSIVVLIYLWLIYDNLTADPIGWWNIVIVCADSALLGMFGWMWWRQKVMDEFAELTRAAIGSDANLVILTARLQLRTGSVRKLNRVMRRYDVMGMPVLDLPPEAKELREILESVRTK
jgi:hypothetical protein